MKAFPFLTLLCAGLFLQSVVLTVAGASDVPGYPDQIEAYDPREVAMLPRYCIYTPLFRDRVPGGNNRVEIQKWSTVLGPTFEAMHHYCWGLMKTNRALYLARRKQLKDHYLGSSITEFDYVLQRAPPNFMLLPEILAKKGENLVRLGQGELGAKQLERALELKPDYWPPYATLSDYYKENGQVATARELLLKGLSFAPDAKGLKDRLARLESGTAK